MIIPTKGRGFIDQGSTLTATLGSIETQNLEAAKLLPPITDSPNPAHVSNLTSIYDSFSCSSTI